MAGSLNKVMLIGRVGRDPEVRTFQNGERVVSFSMAMSESWKEKASGERKERTEWSNVSVFNENLGKVAESYVRKGSKVYVEGQLRTREYEKDGVKQRATDVVLPRFGGQLVLLDSRKDGEGQGAEHGGAPVGNMSAQLDDEVPFAPEWR